MTRARRLDVVRGLGALAALAALFFGPPVLLVVGIGWPLPTTVPSLDEIERALTIGIEDQVVLKAAALLCWLAWLQVAVTIVVQVAAALRRQVARPLPVVPGLQAAIGRLVAGATLAVTSVGPLHVSGAATATNVVVVEADASSLAARLAFTGGLAPGIGHGAWPGTMASAWLEPNDEAALPTIEVERHDSYWAIAERTLGDGLRWHQIRDLNVGRTMPDGHTLTDDTAYLHEGWVLVLPADARVPASAGQAQVSPPAAAGGATGRPRPTALPAPAPADQGRSAAPTEVTVEPGDNMWLLAERHLTAVLGRPVSSAEVGPYWLRCIETNRQRFVDPQNPDLVHPGQTFVLPVIEEDPRPTPAGSSRPADQPPPLEPQSRPPSSSPDGDQVPPDPAAPRPTQPSEGQANTIPRTEPGPTTTPSSIDTDSERPAGETSRRGADGGSGLGTAIAALAGATSTALAVGITRAVRRYRQRRNHLAPNTVPQPAQHQDLHRSLLATADDDAHDQLRHALDQLAAVVAKNSYDCRPRVVLHRPDHLDVLLTHAATPALEGWQAEASGQIWTRDPEALVADRAADSDTDGFAAAPLLVTLGQPDEGGQLYVDLEAAGVVALTGDGDVALGVARSMLTELAHSPFSYATQFVVVGDLGSSVGELPHVTVDEGWGRVAQNLISWATQGRDALTASGWANPFVARGHFVARGQGELDSSLSPLVVVATVPPEDPGVLDALLDGPTAAALVIVGDPVEGGTTIECRDDQLLVAQLGLTCTPQPLDPATLTAVVELLDEASDLGGEPLDLFPNEPDSTDSEEAAEADEPYEEPQYDVLVRVLGDIRIDGASEPLTAKQTAVVAYITLHDPAPADQLEDAVWGFRGAGPHRKSLANTLSDCRRLIGTEHLPTADEGRYRPGPGLVADIDLFDARVRAARQQSPERAVETLHGALDLVTGPIFSYRNADKESFGWVEAEHWASTWEGKVAGVAQHLAELHLDLDQPDQAADVAERALRAFPTHNGLTEALMRAHAARGDRRGLKRVYEDHIIALQRLDLDDPLESTTALYDQLRNTNGQG